MIIKENPVSFSVEFEREDWSLAYTYVLLELLKSIPRLDRKFDPVTKLWHVNNSYRHILDRTQVYTDEEESENLAEFEEFLQNLG